MYCTRGVRISHIREEPCPVVHMTPYIPSQSQQILLTKKKVPVQRGLNNKEETVSLTVAQD